MTRADVETFLTRRPSCWSPNSVLRLTPAASPKPPARSNGAAGIRERAYGEAALEGAAAELTAAASGSRNSTLNAIAYRLGRMVARGWLKRADVETGLLEARQANGSVADDGLAAAQATLKSGIDAGERSPHPDLGDGNTEDVTEDAAPENECDGADRSGAATLRPYRLGEVHAVFQKWLGSEYDIATLDAVLATVAAEKLAGDPAWLLIISGAGNAKTETVGATSGLGAVVVSTITSEGALLSATPRKSRVKTATGGLAAAHRRPRHS